MPPRKRSTRKRENVENSSDAEEIPPTKKTRDETCSDDDEIDTELLAHIPRRPRDSENIINIVTRNTNISREQICLLFIEVAKRADQIFEFDIAYWLEKYMKFKESINFCEVALVLVHAGQIFCRKVDLTHEFVSQFNHITTKAINLCEKTKKEAAEIEKAIENGEKVPKKRKSKKKKDQPSTSIPLPFEMFGGEMEPDDLTIVEEKEIQEEFTLKPKEKSIAEGSDSKFCTRLKKKLLIVKLLKQAKRRLRSRRPIFNCEYTVPCDNYDIPNYADESLTDMDDSSTTDVTRRNYFVFMGMIDKTSHCLNLTHNLVAEKEMVCTRDLTACDNFSLSPTCLLPPDYVENVYNVKLRNPLHYYEELRKELNVWGSLGPQRHDERCQRCVLITYSIAAEIMLNSIDQDQNNISMELYDTIITKLTDMCNRFHIPEKITAQNRLDDSRKSKSTPIEESIADSGINDTAGSPRRSSTFSNESIAHQILTSQLRISVDEGVSCGGSRAGTPVLPRLSDLNSLELSLLSPKVQLVDFCEPFTDEDKKNLTVKVQNNQFFVSIIPPAARKESNTSTPIRLNFLKIPESKLRKRTEFSLPMDFKKLKQRKTEEVLHEMLPEVFRISDLSLIENVRSPSPETDFEEFLGFHNEILSSTLVNDESLSPKKTIRSFSRDSGFESQEMSLSQPATTDDQSQSTSGLSDSVFKVPELPRIPEDTEPLVEPEQPRFFFTPQDYDESDATERIKNWHQKMRPITAQARKRSTFDINGYSKDIVDSLRQSPEMSFEAIMQSRPPDFTARYFLTILQMANNENIKIVMPANKSRKSLVSHADFKVKLLDSKLRAEAMDDDQYFEESEPARKKVKITNATTINPIQQIIKRCDVQKELVTGPHISPNFNAFEQIISSRGRRNKSTIESEFGDSGISSMFSSSTFGCTP